MGPATMRWKNKKAMNATPIRGSVHGNLADEAEFIPAIAGGIPLCAEDQTLL